MCPPESSPNGASTQAKGPSVRHERRSGHRSAPVVVRAHTNGAAYAHGKRGVLAQEHKIRCGRVGKRPELVVIELRNLTAYRIDVLLRAGIGRATVDIHQFVARQQGVNLSVGKTVAV